MARASSGSLTRAVLSVAADPMGLLVLILDDGNSHVSVARRAESTGLSDLPPIAGPYLELLPDDFEAVRFATQRTYLAGLAQASLPLARRPPRPRPQTLLIGATLDRFAPAVIHARPSIGPRPLPWRLYAACPAVTASASASRRRWW